MKKSETIKGISMTGKSREAVIVFFESMLEHRFSDAEKALAEVQGRKYANPEFQEGYNKALEGMLTSSRSGDERDFLNKAIYEKEALEKYVDDFREMLRKGMPKPFDMGFFSAWSDLMHYRIASRKYSKP